MWKRIQLILLTGCLLVSCAKHKDYEEPVFKTSYSLESEIIASGDSLMTRYVYGLYVDNQYAYILALSEDYWLQVRDKETGALICRGVHSGQGPGEVIFGYQLRYNAVDDALEIFDKHQYKVVSYKMNTASKSLDLIRENYFTDYDGVVRNAYHLSENQWLVEGQLSTKESGRYLLWDGKDVTAEYSQHITETDDYLKDMLIEVTSKVSISPKGDRLAIGTVYGGILELFSIGSDIKRVGRGIFYEPKVDLVDGNMRPRDDTVFGFADIEATNDEVYAVLMGTTDPNKYDVICTFGWNAQGKIRYQADCQVFKLANIPVVDGILYAISISEDDFNLVKMKLPSS